MTCSTLGRLLLASLPLTLLVACGGGGGAVADLPPPQAPAMTGDVPTSAVASAAAYTQYVAAQAATPGLQPLNLGDLTPPVSDTDAPAPVE